jgi:hypothetical protein
MVQGRWHSIAKHRAATMGSISIFRQSHAERDLESLGRRIHYRAPVNAFKYR